MIPQGLEIAKEECAVFLNRAADGAAKLVPLEGRYPLADIKEVTGVKSCVSQKLKCRPVQTVAAGFGHYVHDPAGFLAVRGAEVARDDGKFLHGINAQHLPQDAARLVILCARAHHLLAVNQEEVGLCSGPIDAK